jgi:long-chain fatty acid transport protein
MRTKILAAVLLAPSLALANGYEVPNVQPRDLAMVSSAVAAQQGASATNSNPAALSKLEGLNLSLAGSILSLSTSWKAPTGSQLTGSADTKFSPVPPVSLFAAYGTKVAGRGLGVGFGLGIPGGGNMHWEDDWTGRGRIVTVERRVYGLYLNGGYEVVPEVLRVGGGGIYYYGSQYLKQGIQPVEGAFGELSAKGGGFAYEAAAELTPLRGVPLSFGIDYKHKGTMEMSGDGHFEVPPALRGPSTQDQKVKTNLTMPNLLAVGAAYRPTKPLLLTAAWTFSRFVVYREDLFVGDQGISITVPRNYRNGYGFRFGAEYDVNKAWTVRGGLFRDISGLQANTYSPTLPDANAWVGAAGASWRVRPDLAVNGAAYYAIRDRVHSAEWRSATNPNGSFPGIYDTTALVVSAGITWRTDVLGR